jgi:hypothetical protein
MSGRKFQNDQNILQFLPRPHDHTTQVGVGRTYSDGESAFQNDVTIVWGNGRSETLENVHKLYAIDCAVTYLGV